MMTFQLVIRLSEYAVVIMMITIGCTDTTTLDQQQQQQQQQQTAKTIVLPPNSRRSVRLGGELSKMFQHVVVPLPPLPHYSFLSLQLHTQYKTVVTSFNRTYVYGQTYNSSNPSVFYLLKQTVTSIDGYIGTNSTTSALSSLVAIATSGRAPIPGGCCLTCAMETDPNIELTYVNGRASLFFHRAAQYYDVGVTSPSCDDSDTPGTYSLKYHVYYRYIDDFTADSLFATIWKMSTPEQIVKYGTSLLELSGRTRLRLTLQPIKGQGVVFNVVVYDPKVKLSSAYTPVSTYHCHFTGPNADCYIKKDVTSVVYCVICATVGLLLCVAGFKLLQLLMFIVGWLMCWLLTYIFLYQRFIDADSDLTRCDVTERDVMIMSSMCAICGGALTTFLFAFRRTMVVSFMTLSLLIGMFLTSILFYTPVGHLPFWDGDDKFLFAFCCISICLATFFFFIPKFLSIFSSSVVGSYAVILVPNYLMGGSLQYIALIVPLRMRSSLDFFLERPYHVLDYILSGVWVLMFVIGTSIQYYTSRDTNIDLSDLNPFSRVTSPPAHTSRTPSCNERTPLVPNTDNEPTNYSFDNRRAGDGPMYTFRQPLINPSAPPPTAPPQLPNEPPPPYSAVAAENETSVEYN